MSVLRIKWGRDLLGPKSKDWGFLWLVMFVVGNAEQAGPACGDTRWHGARHSDKESPRAKRYHRAQED